MRLIKSTRGRVLELTGFRTVAQFARTIGLTRAEAEAGVVASYNQEIIARRVIMREARRVRTNEQARARRAAKRVPRAVIGNQLFHTDAPHVADELNALRVAIVANRGKTIALVHTSDGTSTVLFNDAIPMGDRDVGEFLQKIEFAMQHGSYDRTIFQLLEFEKPNQVQSLTLYVATAIDPVRVAQHFREGIEHCMLQPILNWASDKLASITTDKRGIFRYSTIVKKCKQFIVDYEEGLPEDKMQHVCNALQIDIDVVSPFYFNLKNDHVFSVKCDKKRLKKFTFINSRMNHVDCIANTGGIVQTVSKSVAMTQDELTLFAKELDKTNAFYTFTRGKYGITRINTIDASYEIEDEYRQIIEVHERGTTLDLCKICDYKDRALSQFVKDGVHYNGCIDFKNTRRVDVSTLSHIDMEKAYTQAEWCKYYDGFLSRITDYRKTDTIQGVGIYMIKNLNWAKADPKLMQYNAKMKIYPVQSTHRVTLPSPEIAMLSAMGVTYDIICGCWGEVSIDIKYAPPLFNKGANGIAHYARWAGACDSHTKDNKFYMKASSKELVQIALNKNKYVEASIFEYSNGNGEVCIRYPKTSNRHLAHVTAFITSYQRMNTLEQLMTMDISSVYRVCVDGIYYNGATDIPLCNAFRLKNEPGDKTLSNDAGDEFMSNTYYGDDNGEDDCKIPPARESHRVELHRGEGGSGKTHFNLMDNGLQRVLYVAPSYKLAAAKASYGCDTNVLANLIGANDMRTAEVNRYYSTLLVDEGSMMSSEQVRLLLNRYPTHKIILCGDIGYQLPPIKDKAFNPADIEDIDTIHIVTHNEDYRCACPALRKVKKDLRAFIDTNASAYTIMSYLRKALPTITNAELAEKYELEDMILAGTNAMKDNYTSLVANKFEGKNKYYVTENTREYHNGDIIIGDKPPVKCDIRHCFTVHSVQGETAEHNLYLDTKTMLTPTHIYTAVSRARKIEQLYLVDCNMDRYDGKIYKIVSSVGVYVGSTITSLDARLKGHVAARNAYEKDNTKKRLTSFPLLEDGKIELIENFKCDTQGALLIRESEIIKSMDCVNKTYNEASNVEQSAPPRKQEKEKTRPKPNPKQETSGFKQAEARILQEKYEEQCKREEEEYRRKQEEYRRKQEENRLKQEADRIKQAEARRKQKEDRLKQEKARLVQAELFAIEQNKITELYYDRLGLGEKYKKCKLNEINVSAYKSVRSPNSPELCVTCGDRSSMTIMPQQTQLCGDCYNIHLNLTFARV